MGGGKERFSMGEVSECIGNDWLVLLTYLPRLRFGLVLGGLGGVHIRT